MNLYPTSDEIKEFRDRNGCSLHDAKRRLTVENAISILKESSIDNDIQEILLFILKELD